MFNQIPTICSFAFKFVCFLGTQSSLLIFFSVCFHQNLNANWKARVSCSFWISSFWKSFSFHFLANNCEQINIEKTWKKEKKRKKSNERLEFVVVLFLFFLSFKLLKDKERKKERRKEEEDKVAFLNQMTCESKSLFL